MAKVHNAFGRYTVISARPRLTYESGKGLGRASQICDGRWFTVPVGYRSEYT